MNLTAEQIQQNGVEYKDRIKKYFPSRSEALLSMYYELEDRFLLDPASSYDYFHNAIPGGYLDHVLRVDDFATKQYELWKSVGMDVSLFTEEELHFAALHHDLGKIGLPGSGNNYYLPNPSKWHVENQGKIYTTNPDIHKMPVCDISFFLLNWYQVPYSINEMIGIRTTDGMYDESNKDYLAGFNLNTKLRNCLHYILHHADIMAFRFEFERWTESTGKFKRNVNLERAPNEFINVADVPTSKGKIKGNREISLDAFDDMFKI